MADQRIRIYGLNLFECCGGLFPRSPGSGDGGADGIAVHSETGEQIIVQCKHRQERYCDGEPVDDLLRARDAYDQAGARLIAVTTAERYSAQARERAARHGIELIGLDTLLEFPFAKVR